MSRSIPVEQILKDFKSKHTTSHLFKIDNFSLLKEHRIEMFESSVFDLGGLKWKLFVFPYGCKDANGHVSLCLENQDSINVHIKFEVFVVSQLNKEWHPTGIRDFGTSSTPMKRGYPKLISLADLETKGYLIGDCCFFGAKLHGFEPGKPATAECFSLIEKPLNRKVTWEITKFSSFEPEKYHQSEEFVVGARRWRIEVLSKEFMGTKDKSFSVFLLGKGFINNAPKAKTFAQFKLRVLDKDKRNHFEREGRAWFNAEPDERRGFPSFMALDQLVESYLVNDELYVGVEFELISMVKYC